MASTGIIVSINILTLELYSGNLYLNLIKLIKLLDRNTMFNTICSPSLLFIIKL